MAQQAGELNITHPPISEILPAHRDVLAAADGYVQQGLRARSYEDQVSAFAAAEELCLSYDGANPHGRTLALFLPLLREQAKGDGVDPLAAYEAAGKALQASPPDAGVPSGLLFSALNARAGNQYGFAYPIAKRNQARIVQTDSLQIPVHTGGAAGGHPLTLRIPVARLAAEATTGQPESLDIIRHLARLIIRETEGSPLRPEQLRMLGAAGEAVNGHLGDVLAMHGDRLRSLGRLMAWMPARLHEVLSTNTPDRYRPDTYALLLAQNLPPEYFALQLRNYELNDNPPDLLEQAWDWIDLAFTQTTGTARQRCFAEARSLLSGIIASNENIRSANPAYGQAFIALIFEQALSRQAAGLPVDPATAREIYSSLGKLLSSVSYQKQKGSGGNDTLYHELIALALSARDPHTLAFPASRGRQRELSPEWSSVDAYAYHSDYVPSGDVLVPRRISPGSREIAGSPVLQLNLRRDFWDLIPDIHPAKQRARAAYTRTSDYHKRERSLVDSVARAIIAESGGQTLTKNQRTLLDDVTAGLNVQVRRRAHELRAAQ